MQFNITHLIVSALIIEIVVLAIIGLARHVNGFGCEEFSAR